jgi:hypothetical protein
VTGVQTCALPIYKFLLEKEERYQQTKKIVNFFKKFKPSLLPKESALLKDDDDE